MNKKILKIAFIDSIPVLSGYIVLGIGFGILLVKAGIPLIFAPIMSFLIYGGSAQYVGVSLIENGASLISIFLTTIAVNFRYMFYGFTLNKYYKDSDKYKNYLIFSITDETFSLLCDGKAPSEKDQYLYRFYVSLLDHIYWVVGGMLGATLASIVDFDFKGVEFSMTALFIATFTEQWIKNKNHLPAKIGLIETIICLIIFGKDNFLIPAMIFISISLILFVKDEEHE